MNFTNYVYLNSDINKNQKLAEIDFYGRYSKIR